MRYLILFSLMFGFGSQGYSDVSESQLSIQSKLEQLVELDNQIEALQKQKAQLKEEAEAHLERGGTALLPGAARRNDREGAEDLKEIQALNEQIEMLETQRRELQLELK